MSDQSDPNKDETPSAPVEGESAEDPSTPAHEQVEQVHEEQAENTDDEPQTD